MELVRMVKKVLSVEQMIIQNATQAQTGKLILSPAHYKPFNRLINRLASQTGRRSTQSITIVTHSNYSFRWQWKISNTGKCGQ